MCVLGGVIILNPNVPSSPPSHPSPVPSSAHHLIITHHRLHPASPHLNIYKQYVRSRGLRRTFAHTCDCLFLLLSDRARRHRPKNGAKATWPREEVISPTKVCCRCSHYPTNFWSLCEFQVRMIVSHPYIAANSLVWSAMTRAVQTGIGTFLKGFVPGFGQLVLDAKRRRVCVPNEVMRIVFQFAGRDSRRSPHPVALAFLSDPVIQEVMALRKRVIRRFHFSVDVK